MSAIQSVTILGDWSKSPEMESTEGITELNLNPIHHSSAYCDEQVVHAEVEELDEVNNYEADQDLGEWIECYDEEGAPPFVSTSCCSCSPTEHITSMTRPSQTPTQR